MNQLVKHRIPHYTDNAKYLYDYTKAAPLFFKTGYVISIFSWFVIGGSYIYVFNTNVFFWFLYAPIIFYIVIYNVFSKAIMLTYPKFDLVYHNKIKQTWIHRNDFPTIDIFLPICGEPIEVLKNTWEGVISLKNNYPGICTPYVLDDKGNSDIEIIVKQLGFTYISRPNAGEMKKAGNLKYAFDRSQGDFIVIFDADFRPEPNFLDELMPYFLTENTRDQGHEVGIVQSPQCFIVTPELNKKYPLAYGAASIQEYFYHFIQPARQAFGNGAICVGSNAIYRRKALNTIGGTAQIEHSEDVWTGFKLANKGWRLKYIPLCVAFGDCPSNAQSFYKQQSRWCTGSMSLMTSKEFWSAKLPWYTKMCFISGFTFYISNVLYLFLPIITLANLLSGHFGIATWYYYFVALMLLNALFLLNNHIYPTRKVSTIVAHMIAAWSYVFTLFNLLFKRSEPWLPTGAKMKLSSNYLLLRRVIILYIFILIGGGVLAYFIVGNRLLEPINLSYIGWLGLNVFNHGFALYGLYKYT